MATKVKEISNSVASPEPKENKPSAAGKAFRIIGLIAIIIIIFAAIITSMTIKTPASSQVWFEEMTVGNKDAKNYFYTYTDIVCPYCVAFENAIIEHEDEFEKYIEENDILFEVRLSNFLYRYGQFQTKHSNYSAIAAYCAKDEGKFWEYYRHAITTIWHDYFETYGKNALTILDKNDKSYWLDLGKQIGLGESFATCYNEEKPAPIIDEQADKTAKVVSGLPSFKFNSYSPPGFDMTWGWEYVKMFFDEGLKSR